MMFFTIKVPTFYMKLTFYEIWYLYIKGCLLSDLAHIAVLRPV